MDVVHMPKARSISGHEWLLTMVDVCSRWAIARPVTTIANEVIARIATEEWGKVGMHINVQKVTHDRGGEFKKHFEDDTYCMPPTAD